MNNLKLCQIIAITKGVSSETQKAISKLHQANQKDALFNGQERTFEPLEDENMLPQESTKVQIRADDQVSNFIEQFSEYLDVQATRDLGNTRARASVVVDGVNILKDVPATLLLTLEKELDKIQTFFAELPELDPAEEWQYDGNSALWRAESRKTHKSKKMQRPRS